MTGSEVKLLIAIPARYGATRFPGKPLANICGKPMLQRVYEIARVAAEGRSCEVLALTEDRRIADFCEKADINYAMTSDNCKTGSDRIVEAVKKLDYKPDFILNLQGDAPLTPPWFLEKMMDKFLENRDEKMFMVTPGYKMTWEELDVMREEKKTTPFTGTTIILDLLDQQSSNAIWFSKNIIPAIREEAKLREKDKFSPIIRHIGLYGYSYDMLLKFGELREGYYEKLEGLEQLRALENGYRIKVAMVDYRGRPSSSGVDTPEDIKRAEDIIKKFGELSDGSN
jgi:3-deoxy-manno-octulosonate cytidylyltransferase (CMP-KDO synthetase)